MQHHFPSCRDVEGVLDENSDRTFKRLAKMTASRKTGEDAPTPADEEILKTTKTLVGAVGGDKQIVDVQDAVWHDNRAHLLALKEEMNCASRPMLWHEDGAKPTTVCITDGKAYRSCLSTARLCTMPTQQELVTISQRIGCECILLGVKLGLDKPEIDQIQMDPNSRHGPNFIFEILWTWEKKQGMNATFGYLEIAMIAVGIDTINVFKDIDDWDT